MPGELAGADAVVVGDGVVPDRVALDAAPVLGTIARAGTGAGYVDLDAATERGIQVTRAPDAAALSTATVRVAAVRSQRAPAARQQTSGRLVPAGVG
ncbi:Rossmann-fold NAD(P)-binding domain-containing protein [Streptomyces lancefieldiae]|uniref:D-isomer specific 2-hydroxyacid dehydrogenase catalytic domain-containing protein n=1 Tax=Streptomyces lancefieldiae TaxID=3075520 RepID=A0ABU3ALT9_9ACTN|nr:hypothetical protein [Streptomyces sp. DSM 40712]MDT0610048.1 hypothetical protein [Streptomyces sp. DSM 40712]